MLEKISIIFVISIISTTSFVYAQSFEPEIGLEVGQWVKYRHSVSFGGDDDLKKSLESMAGSIKEQFQDTFGFDMDSVIWIQYTVSDVSGTVVTFDRSAKLASDPETRDEFMLQLIQGTLNPEDSNDESIMSKIYEKELEPMQFDLSEFYPVSFFVMPTNLEFGSKFDGESNYGDITFSNISEFASAEGKTNVFTAGKMFTQDIRQGVVENTMEFDNLASFYFDRQTGVLLERTIDTQITNLNTYDSGWITFRTTFLERSDVSKPTNADRQTNDRNNILEKLSYFFVESVDSEFLFTNGVDSTGDPKRTTFDIIRVSDGYELGSLILQGDEKISAVRTSTLVGGDVKLLQSDRVHGQVLQSLVLGCESLVPEHADLYLENADKGSAMTETMCDDISVSRSWVETSADLQMGIFVQEIVFDKDQKQIQENVPIKQDEQLSSNEGGGCLIATATYGTELSPQVQQLREVRDNYLLQTESGSKFMNSFNEFYYSFSPAVADYERENPAFRELVKIVITPMIASLSILNYVDAYTEESVISYGISLILLNVGMYCVAPAIAIIGIRRKIKCNF